MLNILYTPTDLETNLTNDGSDSELACESDGFIFEALEDCISLHVSVDIFFIVAHRSTIRRTRIVQLSSDEKE